MDGSHSAIRVYALEEHVYSLDMYSRISSSPSVPDQLSSCITSLTRAVDAVDWTGKASGFEL